MRHVVTCFALAVMAAVLPRLAAAGDVEIAQQIAAQLRAQKDAQQLKGFHIGVKVENAKVWMKGQVSDARQQALALDVARRVPGVQVVINELHVAPANAAAMTPAAPTAPAGLSQPAALPAPASAAIPLRQPASALLAVPAAATTATSAVAYDQTDALPQAEVQTPGLVQVMPAAPVISGSSDGLTGSSLTLSAPMVTGSAPARPALVRSQVPSLYVSPPPATQAMAQEMTMTVQQAAPLVAQQPVQQPVPLATQQPIPVAIRTAAGGQPLNTMSVNRPIARAAAAIESAPYTVGDEMPAAPMGSPSAAVGGGVPGVVYDNPNMPSYAWPGYASYPNYAAVTYPQQYSPTAWPYIGPFYPYPQVPLGWRKVTLEWDDGWWFLDFTAK